MIVAPAMKNGELENYIEIDSRHDNSEYIKLDVSLWKVEQKSEKSPFLSGEIKTWGEMKARYAEQDAKNNGAIDDDDFGINF